MVLIIKVTDVVFTAVIAINYDDVVLIYHLIANIWRQISSQVVILARHGQSGTHVLLSIHSIVEETFLGA